MGDLTAEAFVKRVWAPMEAAFGPQPDERRKLYQAMFVGRSDERPLVRAVAAAIETSRFFPTVAELRDRAGLNEDEGLSAEIAWERVRECTRYDRALPEDARVMAAVRAVGGMSRFGEVRTADLGHLRREFFAVYASHREAERRGMLTPHQEEAARQIETARARAALPAPEPEERGKTFAEMTPEEQANHKVWWAKIMESLGGGSGGADESARQRSIAAAERGDMARAGGDDA